MEYSFRINKRAKRILVTVYPSGEVVVTSPKKISADVIQKFLTQKTGWIERAQEKFKKYPEQSIARVQHTKVEILEYKKQAMSLINEKLHQFNRHYRFSYTSVVVRNQKTRWGSCSRSGTLSFNYRLALIPPHLADYVIVHELCHLKQMNHSLKFWKLVEETVPDYLLRRKELRLLKA